MTITNKDFTTDRVKELLNEHFRPDLASGGQIIDGKELSEEESQECWASNFRRSIPRIKRQCLRYICDATSEYYNQNLVGNVCQKYVWSEFFKAFPDGKILITNIAQDWFREIWQGQSSYSRSINFEENNPCYQSPQEMSGFQVDLFPLNALLIAAYGIYPLILFDYTQTFGNFVFIYLPYQAFTHSQMTQGSAYEHILWRLHHFFDDQWTFDSHRGPKSKTPSINVQPTENIEYIEWTIEHINNRMQDLISISNPIRRE